VATGRPGSSPGVGTIFLWYRSRALWRPPLTMPPGPAASPAGAAIQNRGYDMVANYLPILMFIMTGVVVGIVTLIAGRVVGPHRPDSEKDSPYECGFEAFEDSRMKFDVRYYLVAILFIIFDLEIAFLFPWAVALDGMATTGFVAMAMFLGVLVIGFIYEWKKGALEWE